jgi:M6 family metalloprotease-like protein
MDMKINPHIRRQESRELKMISSFLSLIVLLAVSPLFAQKMHLKPYAAASKAKIHPYSDQLIQAQSAPTQRKQGWGYDRLLVILVDFQEEVIDDPNTTGNGKFQLEADPNYIYSIGAPPHDRLYFETNLEAMRYYYLAASAGAYDLNYDVWPKDKAAYTLPHSMGYYNPPGISSTQFVQNMEEYFKDAFETADEDDPGLDFGSYGHYMIIHAGSDWQHDILGDSPSDLPSFFIRVGDGKQVVVDNGTTEIFTACNVPATISQDFTISQEDGYSIHSGYGALNSVLFHEFGHSLGLVDLYNVRNFYPMVGAFDIMDSGGAGVLVDELDNGDLVLVEGALPALPGAFSRALLFEEDFRHRGLMHDISDYELYNPGHIAASSFQQMDVAHPSIIKFSLNPNEYYLIENRSVDPDGDGGTAVYGTLDSRVILYPTAFADQANTPTYEYDYLLPSFVKADGSAVGGGLMVWYVNENVIYHEGSILEDGSLWSNFENNTVNTNFGRPGVRVLEADGLQDIGEPYSAYWTGTPYEYFHARQPELNGNGQFVRWSSEIWRPKLGAETDPAMLDASGIGSMYHLDNISDPAAVMSFVLKSSFWDDTFSANLISGLRSGPAINTNYSDLAIPFLGPDGIQLYSYLNNEWQDLMGISVIPDYFFDYPLISVDTNADGYMELIGIRGKVMHFIDFANINPEFRMITFPDSLYAPIMHNHNVYTHTDNCVYRISDFGIANFCSFGGIRGMAGWGENLVILKSRELMVINNQDFSILNTVNLAEDFGDYDPVLWHFDDQYLIFITANSGNIYRYNGSSLKKIFTNHTAALPSQPALYMDSEDGLQVFFGLGNRAYLMLHNGLLNSAFPLYLDGIQIKEHGYSRALKVTDGYLMHLPVKDQGYLGVFANGSLSPEYSLLYPINPDSWELTRQDFMHYDEAEQSLIWNYPIRTPSAYRGFIHTKAFTENPILWNGKHNNAAGAVTGMPLNGDYPNTAPLDAYVFPNPVKSNAFRLRVSGAYQAFQLRIYDISGTKVLSKTIEDNNPVEDIELDARRLSSGVYLIHIKCGSRSKTIKFAIEK